ncbi:MAG: phosphotransferase [Candidatus Electryoneaceae bacterium]|nr:phosphotransferase [Candidatus Electryoneaceae bacterium]
MSGTTDKFSVGQLSQYLELPIRSLDLIKGNKYCYIFKAAGEDDKPFIIKQYKGDDPALVTAEAEALDRYYAIAKDDPRLINSRTLLLVPERNLLAIEFVSGEPFSEFLYRSRNNPELQQRAVRIMSVLGEFLRHLYELTVIPDGEPSPFLLEYITYCSERLEKLRILGKRLFGGSIESAVELWNGLLKAKVAPSFIHGDFVFLNIHVSGERVGLIDFANTNLHSHLLNDLYNMRLALDNMLLPESFKEMLLSALYDGLGDISFPVVAHRFYYEYHRRRWLMLKMMSNNPWHRIQAIRGLTSFAKPFDPERVIR